MPPKSSSLVYEFTDHGKYLKVYDTFNHTHDEIFNIRIVDPEIRRNFEAAFTAILNTQGPTKAILWLVALDTKARKLLKRRSPSPEPINELVLAPIVDATATTATTSAGKEATGPKKENPST